MKKLFIAYRPENSFFSEIALTVLRVGVGFTMALAHGIHKTPPPEQFVQGVAGLGFPMPELFAWAASLAELAGGILIGIGLFTRPAAAMLLFTMAVAFFGAHGADPFAKKEMSFLYGLFAFYFMIRGSSRYSIDSLMK